MILRSEKHLEIKCQNRPINLHSPAVCRAYYYTEFGRDVTAYLKGQMLDVLSSSSVNL